MTNNISGPNLNNAPGVSQGNVSRNDAPASNFTAAKANRDVSNAGGEPVKTVSASLEQAVDIAAQDATAPHNTALPTLPRAALRQLDPARTDLEPGDGLEANENEELAADGDTNFPPVTDTLPHSAVTGYSEAVMLGAGRIIAGELDT